MNMTIARMLVMTCSALLLLWPGLLPGPGAAGAADPKRKPTAATRAKIGHLLRKWRAEGTAAGNAGDYYDNRDRGHSRFGIARYPQLQKVKYTPQERARRADWGGQRVILPYVVFGNSSTASHVTSGGCQTRRYYSNSRGVAFLFTQYVRNNLYVYPEHLDHGVGHNGPGYGDIFPTNTPYVITSQGSSGSDQPFLRAIAHALAALRPEVKRRLVKTGLLMPTLQMIFRITNKNVGGAKEYLTGKAHPTVFLGVNVDAEAMMRMAHAIRLNNIPPAAALKVVSEDEAAHGKDFFDPGKSEKLADTPGVIARVVRGRRYLRRMVVSAEASIDLNKRPLTYRWVVLRGDAARIEIKPLNKAGSVAEIVVPYHDRRPVTDGARLESNRVDVGVFVHNGAYYSAPAFITFFSLDSEARTYDKSGRVLEIAYGAGASKISVTDWGAVFKALQAKAVSWPVRLFREQFTPAEATAVARIAGEHEKARLAIAEADGKYKPALKAFRAAYKERKAAGKALAAARKEHEAKPAAETRDALRKAELALAAAREKVKATTKRKRAADKRLKNARRAAYKLLDSKAAGQKLSAGELVYRAFDALAQDALFVSRNHKEINSLFRAASRSRKRSVTMTRNRLVALDIITDDAAFAHALRPAVEGAAPAAQRLTRLERSMLERLNRTVLANLLYPGMVKAAYRTNYVDWSLSAPKAWRDVYRHNARGEVIGWTRIDGGKRTAFNADGLIVLARDSSGRCTMGRTVTYKRAPPRRDAKGRIVRSARRLLRFAPGDKIVHYQYAGKDDWKGRVSKQEPAPGK